MLISANTLWLTYRNITSLDRLIHFVDEFPVGSISVTCHVCKKISFLLPRKCIAWISVDVFARIVFTQVNWEDMIITCKFWIKLCFITLRSYIGNINWKMVILINGFGSRIILYHSFNYIDFVGDCVYYFILLFCFTDISLL